MRCFMNTFASSLLQNPGNSLRILERMTTRDKGNPNSLIQSELQRLRSEREQVLSDIDSLEEEKRVIQKIMPKVYYEMTQVRDSMDHKKKELVVFDTAIEEIEKNYGDFLYSPEIFKSDVN